ncbi:hypothetical protein [Amorphus coralli]|uniref:hypothetical protein n=1 Tax=Amorphus coralli TaxID=340680 RepID=UPI0012EC187C|nr:hypothetical protein [Amorphus coralli]
MDFEASAIFGIDRDRVPRAVGRATIAWNNVSFSVYQLFQFLSGLDEESAKAAFFCITSDRSQRDMLGALVETRLKRKNAAAAKQAMTILGKINGLSGRRNDILHIVFMDDHDPKSVHPFHERGHIKGKSGEELVSSIDSLTDACLQVSNDLLQITIDLLKEKRDQQTLIEVLRTYTPPPASAGASNPMGLGLLGFLATTDSSPEKDPE